MHMWWSRRGLVALQDERLKFKPLGNKKKIEIKNASVDFETSGKNLKVKKKIVMKSFSKLPFGQESRSNSYGKTTLKKVTDLLVNKNAKIKFGNVYSKPNY